MRSNCSHLIQNKNLKYNTYLQDYTTHVKESRTKERKQQVNTWKEQKGKTGTSRRDRKRIGKEIIETEG